MGYTFFCPYCCSTQEKYEYQEDGRRKFRCASCGTPAEASGLKEESTFGRAKVLCIDDDNYAQRSGRAGRSGQPALVFGYCTIGSPHDQYYFKRPNLMVAGAVAPPRLDLADEDVVRAHIHSICLAESHLSLGKSLKDILDVAGDDPTLNLQEGVRADVEAEGPRKRARARAEKVIATFRAELLSSGWCHDGWLDDTLTQVARRFDQTCDRWRGLYRSALAQARLQDKIIRDATRSADDKNHA